MSLLPKKKKKDSARLFWSCVRISRDGLPKHFAATQTETGQSRRHLFSKLHKQASDAVGGIDFGDGTLSNRNTGAGRVQKSAETTTYLRIASLFGSLCETSVCMRMFGRALKFEIRSCATTFSPHGPAFAFGLRRAHDEESLNRRCDL
jgi:hypothetical protein